MTSSRAPEPGRPEPGTGAPLHGPLQAGDPDDDEELLLAPAEPELPKQLTRYLLPEERLVVAVRRHPAQLAEPFATVTLGFVLLLLADEVLGRSAPGVPHLRDVLFLAWFALLARTLWRFLQWRADWFVATERRLLLTYGVLNRKVAMMPVSKVTDMSYNQSLLGRLLNYGEFVMESAGQEQALRVVSWLPVPDQLYLSICAEIFGAHSLPPVLPLSPRRRRIRRVQR